MTAKEYLAQVRLITIRLQSMVRQVQVITDTLTNISPVLTDMPRSATPNVHSLDALVATKVDLENEIAEATTKLADITRTVNSLPDHLHIAVLSYRYFCKMEWREVADELRITESRAYQLHRQALVVLENVIVDCS